MKSKIIILIIVVVVLLGAGSYHIYGWYSDKQEAKRLKQQREITQLIIDRANRLFPGTWTIERLPVEITFYEDGSYYLVDKEKGNIKGEWHIGPALISNPKPVLWLDNDWLLYLITEDDIFWAWTLEDGPKNKNIFHRKIK